MTTDSHTVTLQEITAETLSSILALQVRDEQRHLVATNARSIAQAHFDDHAWFRGIYAGDKPVGFVLLCLNQDKPEYWVWRFMIDAAHQGKGYGRQAMELVADRVRDLPAVAEGMASDQSEAAGLLYLSYVPDEASAGPFYTRCGFVETGDVDDGENVMVLGL